MKEISKDLFDKIYNYLSRELEIDATCVELNEILDELDKANEECKEWICTDDYQGMGFHIGDTKTPEGWQEWALGMSEISESEDRDRFAALPPLEAMEYVADMWQIGLEPFDENNAEHVKLREEYEND